MMNNSLLHYNSVEISYKNIPVVHDISFSLKQGEILGLVGESGSGKSTLIKAAMGLLGKEGSITKGNILFKGNTLRDMSEREFRSLRGAEISMIFQDAGAFLCPVRTIGSQIYESIAAHQKITKAKAKDYALDLFHKLNFKEPERIWKNYPFELSGGMNQRVGIAISMLMKPSLLLADEPTSALDVAIQRQVIQEMLHIREIFNTSIILVSHDIGVVSAMADTIMVLQNGKQVEYGSTPSILEHPQKEYTKELLSAMPKLCRS